MSKKAKPHPNAVSSESRNKMNELAPQAGFYPARDVGGDPCDIGEKVIPSEDLILSKLIDHWFLHLQEAFITT